MALEEEPDFEPVTGDDQVKHLVRLVSEGALDPTQIGDPEVRDKVLAQLQRQV